MLPLYDTARSRRAPLVNWLLIALNVLVFLYELSLPSPTLGRFIRTWGLVPVRLITQPQAGWITIFTAMFLHGGWLHMLSNMWILFIFGDNVEDRMGHGRYLLFYLLSGLAAAFLQSYWTLGSRMPMIGASGAIAGVLGAYMVLFPYSRIASLVPILFIFTVVEIPAPLYLLFWFISQLFAGLFSLEGAVGGVAWWAHVGGFIFGMLTVRLFARRRIYPF